MIIDTLGDKAKANQVSGVSRKDRVLTRIQYQKAYDPSKPSKLTFKITQLD